MAFAQSLTDVTYAQSGQHVIVVRKMEHTHGVDEILREFDTKILATL